MILWVDDDTSSTLEIYSDLLRSSGYEIKMVQSADESLMYLQTNSKDIECMIVDIMMPVGSFDSSETKMGMLTGLVLLKKIKAIDALKKIPIIIFTIYDEKEVAKWARDNKVVYLNKHDTTPAELLDVIKNKLRAINIQ